MYCKALFFLLLWYDLEIVMLNIQVALVTLSLPGTAYTATVFWLHQKLSLPCDILSEPGVVIIPL